MEAIKFLDLFPEIRDEIYFIFLSPPFPNGQRSAAVSYASSIPRARADEEMFEGCNHYPLNPPKVTTLPLLLSNRQIHTEVKAAVSRYVAAGRLCYHLDCELAGERYIYPTWMHVPAFAHHVPCVRTDFHISGEYTGNRSAWNWGCGGPGQMVWTLFALLKRFLERGPHFLVRLITPPPQGEPGHPLRVTVDRLVLNVVTPLLAPGQHFKDPGEDSPQMRPFGRDPQGALNLNVMHPDTVVREMQSYLRLLFNGDRDTLEYGKLVARGVKTVHLLHDGVEKKIWDLESMMYLH